MKEEKSVNISVITSTPEDGSHVLRTETITPECWEIVRMPISPEEAREIINRATPQPELNRQD